MTVPLAGQVRRRSDAPGDRIFSGAPSSPAALILAVLAAVAIFLVVQSIPAFTAEPGELPDAPPRLLDVRRPARLRHHLGRRSSR